MVEITYDDATGTPTIIGTDGEPYVYNPGDMYVNPAELSTRMIRETD